ncbi:unnamed protein product [Pylaiella littoralis]
MFPGRLELVLGDSSVTVPAYAAAEAAAGRDPQACSVVFVDGSLSEEGAYADLVNFRAMTSKGWNAVALDDLDIPSVSAAWRRFSRDEGKGRLGRVVQATAEHITHAQVGGEKGDGRWGISFNGMTHRVFMRRGYLSLGVGVFRF